MSIEAQVKAAIERERATGKTHQQIAETHRIPTSYVTNLLNGRCKYKGMSVGIIDRMFPKARVSLTGDPPLSIAHSAIGNSNTIGDRSEVLRAQIILDLLDLAIDTNTLTIVLKTVKQAKA